MESPGLARSRLEDQGTEQRSPVQGQGARLEHSVVGRGEALKGNQERRSGRTRASQEVTPDPLVCWQSPKSKSILSGAPG